MTPTTPGATDPHDLTGFAAAQRVFEQVLERHSGGEPDESALQLLSTGH